MPAPLPPTHDQLFDRRQVEDIHQIATLIRCCLFIGQDSVGLGQGVRRKWRMQEEYISKGSVKGLIGFVLRVLGEHTEDTLVEGAGD